MDKKKRYYINNEDYYNQVRELQSGERGIPEAIFCKKFLVKLEEGRERVSKLGLPLDSEDALGHSLGYALEKNVNLNSIRLARELKIFTWVEFYQALNNDDLESLEETVIEILDLEKKWLNQ